MIALVRSVLCDLMPRSEQLPGIDDTGVTAFLVKLRHESTSLYWTGVVAGAFVYALTPVLSVGRPLPSFLLPARLRNLHAQRIVNSRLYLVRQAVFLLRLSAGMCWGMHPTIRTHFGLTPYPEDPGTLRTT